MRRGELYRVKHVSGDPKRSRVVVIVSRDSLVDVPFSSLVCAPVHTERRGIVTEVHVGVREGLKHDSAILCDGLLSVGKTQLTDYVGSLGPDALERLADALRVALDVELV
jgi:mRNA interferase MazF